MGAPKKEDDKKEEKPKKSAPKKEINKRSVKMKEAMKGYKKEAKKFMAENPKCQVQGCTKKSDHIHHKAGRIGKNLTDVKNWLAVCAEHHTQIETDVIWAKENNYSVNRLTA